MMQFMLLFSRQGKLRLQKWYVAHPDKLKKKITRELITTILARKPKMSSFLEWKDVKVVYKRYASLYFCCAIEQNDNELLTLEIIHRYVELLDKYFGSVCELDIIFNYEKAYFILDELLVGGEIQETSKKNVLKAIAAQDLLQEIYGSIVTSMKIIAMDMLLVVHILLTICIMEILINNEFLLFLLFSIYVRVRACVCAYVRMCVRVCMHSYCILIINSLTFI
nr:AP-1 complex subunit sigma-2 isoform X1 [Vespula vulgaris]